MGIAPRDKNSPRHAAAARSLGRRSFLKGSVAVTGLSVTASLQALLGQPANAVKLPYSPDYGPLVPTLDESTGLPLILLPEGFRYITFGWTGDPMQGGTLTPGAHDGMAVAAVRKDQIVLVRNHELGTGTPFAPAAQVYDPGASGGTTNLTFHLSQGQWEESWASLSGTIRNCAGGPTPWGSWLTCEETLVEPPTNPLTQTHGWIFDVPAYGKAKPVPLKDMGRFTHEAVAVEPVTGYVYETEDHTPSGFYRFLPNEYGELRRGGQLQMLKVEGQSQLDLSSGVAVGSVFPVTWVDIYDPERAHTPATTDGHGVFMQGWQQGGASFSRLERCWYDSGNIYFTSTDGGDAGEGQVWEYDPRRQQLRLLYESPLEAVLDNPDNITVSPRGGIILCEDGDLQGQRLIGLTPQGQIFPFAQNNVILSGQKNGISGDFRGREWAGANFSPDGRWLFANIQTPGITFAITGLWDNGAL